MSSRVELREKEQGGFLLRPLGWHSWWEMLGACTHAAPAPPPPISLEESHCSLLYTPARSFYGNF